MINKIELNKDLQNAYMLVTLDDTREILVQLEKEENRLHADYGTYSIDISSNASDENENLDEDEISRILSELHNKFAEEVEDFEAFGLEIDEHYNN